ncbi:MAG: cell division topological specificity factor MinE [Moraxella sp.]|nr:cell division topological specificity factor MinE [Moraxella sp.]
MKKRGFWSMFGNSEEGPTSASVAKDRLKVIVASNRHLSVRLTPERLDEMKREILAVVNRFVSGVQIDDVNIKQRSEDSLEVLEMNINLPDRKEIDIAEQTHSN